MSDYEEKQGDKKGWFGKTFNKLKSALSKTKTAIVGDEGSEAPETPETFTERSTQIPDQIQAPVSEPVSEPVKAAPHPYVNESLATGELPQIEPAITMEPGTARQVEKVVEEKPETPTFRFEPISGTSRSRALTEEKVEARTVVVDDEFLETLEERLIKADLGLGNAESVIDHLRRNADSKSWTQDRVVDFLKQEFLSILKAAPTSILSYDPDRLNIYLVVGVNGTGKTTSIGKLCWRLKKEGKKVLMAAGDTFRAAAESQLEIWSKRAEVDIVRLEDGADPGAVVYKALEKARSENYDCLVIDTAGRLHNKTNLMAELKKVRGVIDKHGSDCNLESLLVIDASTGQNGLQQARVFTEVCSLTGVVLTKLDGSAKGGIVFSIARELDIPVKLIGLGEQIDDLKDFEPEMFVEALL